MFAKNKPLYLFVIMALLLSACASGAAAQGSTPDAESQGTEKVRTLTVTGSGKVYVEPDIAYVNIGVHTEAESAKQALQENSQLSEEVTQALLDLGVDEKDIQTRNFNISPQPEYTPDGKPTGKINYIVDNSVFVTVRELDKLGELLDAAVGAGANSIYGIQFDLEDQSAALDEARTKAVEDARRTAQTLASAAKVSLGDILSINVFGGASPAPYIMGKGGGAMAVAEAAVPVSPGQMVISVEVNLVYEING